MIPGSCFGQVMPEAERLIQTYDIAKGLVRDFKIFPHENEESRRRDARHRRVRTRLAAHVDGGPALPHQRMGGAEVDRYCREGRIAEVAAYCEIDVVNTYRVWLRYELFRGRLTENGLRASKANLSDYIRSRSDAKPHLAYVLVEEQNKALGPDRRPGVQSEGDGEIFIPDTPGV